MHDETSSDATKPTPTTTPPPDDEPSAELSRAAREAVRQPPDPRLEKQFAYLGLWGESETTAAPTTEADPTQLAEALAGLEAATEGLARRVDDAMRLLALVVRLLVVLTVVVVGLVILVLGRSLI